MFRFCSSRHRLRRHRCTPSVKTSTPLIRRVCETTKSTRLRPDVFEFSGTRSGSWRRQFRFARVSQTTDAGNYLTGIKNKHSRKHAVRGTVILSRKSARDAAGTLRAIRLGWNCNFLASRLCADNPFYGSRKRKTRLVCTAIRRLKFHQGRKCNLKRKKTHDKNPIIFVNLF